VDVSGVRMFGNSQFPTFKPETVVDRTRAKTRPKFLAPMTPATSGDMAWGEQLLEKAMERERGPQSF